VGAGINVCRDFISTGAPNFSRYRGRQRYAKCYQWCEWFKRAWKTLNQDFR